jgi:uncharacterized membrane protein YphA (DoxX/SURF4 family)
LLGSWSKVEIALLTTLRTFKINPTETHITTSPHLAIELESKIPDNFQGKSAIKNTLGQWAVLMMRLLTGVTFLASGLLKSLDLRAFAITIQNLGLGLMPVAWEIAAMLCVVEIILGVFLVMGLLLRFSSLVSSMLLLLFMSVFFFELILGAIWLANIAIRLYIQRVQVELRAQTTD